MSLTLKRVIIVLLGLIGASMAWPCLLAIQNAQASFPGYLSFSIAQGIALGAVFGSIFGSIEGIVVSSRPKAVKGLAFGALAGALSGAIGVIGGQAFLFYAADALATTQRTISGVALALANGAGWVIIGVCVAMIEGFRARSARKILVGLAGGIVGGLIGGITLQLTLSAYPGNGLALLAGLAFFGLALGFFYSLFENGFSLGTVKLLNGPLKNKEYHLVKPRMTIGTKNTCDIVLSGYRDVAEVNACIVSKKGRVAISVTPGSKPIKLNEEKTEDAALRREDVFSIGSAKFMYGIFS